jgi:hypothetical protein
MYIPITVYRLRKKSVMIMYIPIPIDEKQFNYMHAFTLSLHDFKRGKCFFKKVSMRRKMDVSA